MKNKIIEVIGIKLPDTFSEKRLLRSPLNHLDGSRLDAYDLEHLDDDTIFYDVFFDIRNRFLYTIGPPFLNLRNHLFPITCRFNNNKEKHLLKVEEYFDNKLAIGRIPLKGLSLYNENYLELDFNNRFQWSGKIKVNRYEPKTVVLTTIQKDNRIRWIKDWIEFYSQNYKIDQTVIYDNNSSNRSDLKTINSENLLIMAWDYKYGPIRSHENQFCQLGSLNHCRLKFGSKNTIMNFDIDELLCLGKAEFKRYINRYNLTLFNGYRVPYIKPVSEDYSYKNFSLRDPDPQQGGRKYFFQSGNVMVNNIHSALFKRHRFSLYRRLENRYYRLSGVHKKSRLCSCLLGFMSWVLKIKIVPINEAYLLHYNGITTNWKSKYWDRKEETTQSGKLVRFDIFNHNNQ
jgi:hypothetical protein